MLLPIPTCFRKHEAGEALVEAHQQARAMEVAELAELMGREEDAPRTLTPRKPRGGALGGSGKGVMVMSGKGVMVRALLSLPDNLNNLQQLGDIDTARGRACEGDAILEATSAGRLRRGETMPSLLTPGELSNRQTELTENVN